MTHVRKDLAKIADDPVPAYARWVNEQLPTLQTVTLMDAVQHFLPAPTTLDELRAYEAFAADFPLDEIRTYLHENFGVVSLFANGLAANYRGPVSDPDLARRLKATGSPGHRKEAIRLFMAGDEVAKLTVYQHRRSALRKVQSQEGLVVAAFQAGQLTKAQAQWFLPEGLPAALAS